MMKTFIGLLLAVCSFGLQAGEVTRIEAGQTLVANLELAQGKHLKDGVVLMTHGTLAHGQMEIMTSLQELLKEQGVNSLSINLSLGQTNRHGMYDCKSPHRHKHQDAMDEIGGWLKWLKQNRSGPVVLLGHSRGGNQTAWYASENKAADFVKVVLVAPGTWSKNKDVKDYPRRYKKELAPILKKAQSLVKQGKGAQMMTHTDFIYCPDTSVSAASFVSYYQPDKRLHTPNLLSTINKPVLVIAGSEDKVVKGLIEAVKPIADGKKVQLEVIDGADHFFRDLYAEDMTELIVDFMGQ